MKNIMKKIFLYAASYLLLLLTVTSCAQDPEAWNKLVTEAQPGTYIAGTATIYTEGSLASACVLSKAALDNDSADISSIYTWLKKDGTFNIIKVSADGTPVSYGKGDAVTNAAATAGIETNKLLETGTAFSVSNDGLYMVVVNNKDNQISIVPVSFGIIGDATAGAWSTETTMGAPVYDSEQNYVTFTLKGATLDKKSVKFRYGGNWGIEIPSSEIASGTATIHTNMGLVAKIGNLTEAYSECKGGGENFSVDKKGTWDITIRLNLKTKVFSANGKCTGEDTSTAELPTTMFMNGDPYGWDWAKSHQMTPVNGVDGAFWAIQYVSATDGIKFNSAMAWDGNQFGATSTDKLGIGEYESGGENIAFSAPGYYLFIVKTALSADKQSVIKKFVIAQPNVYLMGSVAPDATWTTNSAANKFTIGDDKIFLSPAIATSGSLRMYVSLSDYITTGWDWWRSEFNVYDGVITFRGNGGDQAAVAVTAGQKVKLNFAEGTGVIE